MSILAKIHLCRNEEEGLMPLLYFLFKLSKGLSSQHTLEKLTQTFQARSGSQESLEHSSALAMPHPSATPFGKLLTFRKLKGVTFRKNVAVSASSKEGFTLGFSSSEEIHCLYGLFMLLEPCKADSGQWRNDHRKFIFLFVSLFISSISWSFLLSSSELLMEC